VSRAKYQVYNAAGHIVATMEAASARTAARDYFRANPAESRCGIGRIGERILAYYDRTHADSASRMKCTPAAD
jgi:hypothetical protein